MKGGILAAALVAALSWAGQALAQQEARSADDSDQAASKAGASLEVLDVIVVTATGRSKALSTTKTDTPIIEAPQSISVINRDEIDIRAASTIADALSYSAGVQPEPVGIDSRTDEVAIRGFSAGGFSANNNFVDGLRLPIGGQFSRFGFDTFGLQQIEVLKGPSGVLYGQSAPGGIVNIVTKRPTADRRGEVLLQTQSYTGLDNWSGRVGADYSGRLNDDASLQGRIVGFADDGGTQIDDVDNSRYYISPSLTWEPAEGTRWTFLGQYQRDEGGATYQFLPATGAYRPSNGHRIENDTNLGEPDWNTFERDQLLLASFFEHDFGNGLKLRNNTRYTHVETLYEVTVLAGDTVTDCSSVDYGPQCIDGQTIGRRAIRADGDSDGWATDTRLESRFTTGALDHVLLVGVDYFHTEYEHFRDVVMLPGLPPGQVDPLFNIYDPEPRGSADYAESLQPQIYTGATSQQTGLYLQDQISVGRLRVNLSGRYDRSEDDQTDLIADTSFTSEADELTFRGGAVYLFDNGLAPYASYSESFLPQLVDPAQTLDGEPFEPTTGQQYEAGVRYQSGDNIYLTAGVYEITQRNVPTPDPGGQQCGRRVCQVQTGEARVRGLEFEGRASLDTGTTLIASASRQDSEITESNDPVVAGNELAQVPKYLASLFVDQRIETGVLAGVGFGGGARYTGESFGDTNNEFDIDSYTLFDLFLRYDLGERHAGLKGVSISLNARNIADKRYLVTCTGVQSCYYGQGRVVTARAQYKW